MKKSPLAVILLTILLCASTTSCLCLEVEPAATSTPPVLATAPAGEPIRGGVLVISYGGGTPRHLNPALVSGSSTAIPGTQLFASPLRYDEEWNPQPYLA